MLIRRFVYDGNHLISLQPVLARSNERWRTVDVIYDTVGTDPFMSFSLIHYVTTDLRPLVAPLISVTSRHHLSLLISFIFSPLLVTTSVTIHDPYEVTTGPAAIQVGHPTNGV